MNDERDERLILTIDPKMPHIARDRDGLGWRGWRAGPGAAGIRCDACGRRAASGYIDAMGRARRCDECVTVRP